MARITLNHITKIEGHANLTVRIEKGKVKKCEIGSIEGSRYFEGLVKGRYFNEAPEITSRICGICSSAHTVCSSLAIEKTVGIKPTEQTTLLRELDTIGERIRSHATHLYFLALPDFLGYESALAMTNKFKKEIERALRLIKTGNEIIKVVTGRDLHPISLQVGGFLKLPKNQDLKTLKQGLEKRKKDAVDTVALFSRLKYPKFTKETEYFSLRKKGAYATIGGDIFSKSSRFSPKDYVRYISEYHEPHSTANFVVKEGKAYMVGALARINNNQDKLTNNAKKLIEKSKIYFPNNNPFINNFSQAIEIVHFIDRAIEIIDSLDIHAEDIIWPQVKKGHGIAAIEAPRGILFHEYKTNMDGGIIYANIVTPTAQNLLNLQEDIKEYIPRILGNSKEKTKLEIEKLIRSYDPCFSCSTHFLELKYDMPEEIQTLKKFHTHLGPYALLGYRMGLIAKNTLGQKLSVETFVGNIPPLSCMVDGIQFSSGCTLGKGNIKLNEGYTPKAKFISEKGLLDITLRQEIFDYIKKTLTKGNEEELALYLHSLKDEQLFIF